MMQKPQPSLPTSIAEMNERREMTRIVSEESFAHAKTFQPRPTDVIISPFAKSGTTWLQQMVHTIRTRGSMDFEEITAAVPWLEVALHLDFDIHGEQAANPRAYKSHMDWHNIPKGARYIYSIRNPKDVLVSFYHFFEGWQFKPGSISLDEFAPAFFTNNYEEYGYWKHVTSWWEQRDNPDILFLCFEEMKADLPATVERVAKFIGIELDDELREIAIRQSSIEFMQANRYHFDEKIMKQFINPRRNLPMNTDAAKVRNGRVGEHKQKISTELDIQLDVIWNKTIRETFGYATYSELREAIVAHNKASS